MSLAARCPARPPSLHGLQLWHARMRAAPLQLDLSRDRLSPSQQALSQDLLSLPGAAPYGGEGGQHWLDGESSRQGLVALRGLLGPMLLGIPAEQVALQGNSSLQLMHATVGHLWVRGLPGQRPWSRAGRVRLLCPEPGDDRHFGICRYFGLGMVPVPMRADGPDMDVVEALVATDPTIHGMWCTPRHARPSGCIYSEGVMRRLAAMPAAAPDFTLLCDHGGALLDFDPTHAPAPQLHAACVAAGHAQRALSFGSTSKMTLPGSGIAVFGASPERLRWWLQCQRVHSRRTDTVNQLRHLRLLRSADDIIERMRQHGRLLQLRFRVLESVFRELLDDMAGVQWRSPSGGYHLALKVPAGCAARVATLAADVGVQLPAPGLTHCTGRDAGDCWLPMTPSRLSPDQLRMAAMVVALCVRLASAERAAARATAETAFLSRA